MAWLQAANDRRCGDARCNLGAGAAFDLPEEVAGQLLAAVDELSVRGITLDKPDSLPAEQLVRSSVFMLRRSLFMQCAVQGICI